MFNRSGHSSTQVRKNYSEFQQKGQRFNEFNDHFEGLKVKVTQLCLTLCDPMGYTVHGVLQARILEWVAFPFSRGSSQPRDLPRSSALQADSLPAEHKGGPGILKWVAYLFSSRPTWPRNQIRVSCFAGRFFISWAIKVALLKTYMWKTEQLRKK